MKFLIVVFLISFLSSFTHAEAWRDSLRSARESFKNNEFEKSFFQYTSAQKFAPSSIDLSAETAQVVYRLGKFNISETIFIRSLKTAKSSFFKSEIYRMIGNAQFRQNKLKEAISSFKLALKFNSDDEIARYNLAVSLKKLKNLQQPKTNSQGEENDQQETTEKTSLNNPTNTTNVNTSVEKYKHVSNEIDLKRLKQIKAEITQREIDAHQKMTRLYGAESIHGAKALKDW